MALACGSVGASLVGMTVAGGKSRVRSSLVWAMLLLVYFPSFISVQFGQWSLLPFLALVLGWLSWRKGKVLTAGAILGGLAAIKLFFGAFFLLFLARRRWRAAAAFVAVWLLCTGVSVAVLGFESLLQYRSVVQEANWFSASWNASFLGFFTRIFGGAGNVPVVHAPSLGFVLSHVLSVLAVASLFLLPRRTPGRQTQVAERDLAFGLCIPVMLLVSPFGWLYYFPFLLIPLAILWERSRSTDSPWILRLFIVLTWILGTVPRSLIPTIDMVGDPIVAFWWGGTYFYSLVLFWGMAWLLGWGLDRELRPDKMTIS